jgi:hypothetical protein
MIKQLMYKWFGLSDPPCETCDILRMQLEKSDAERRDLLHRLLEKDRPEPPSLPTEEWKPITQGHVPWRVRQQMLEAEDRAKAALIKQSRENVEKLEEELGVKP